MQPAYEPNQQMRDAVERNFTYHPPRPGQSDRYEFLRASGKQLATHIIEQTPYCDEQLQALRAVSEAVMWANAAIARYDEFAP